MKTILNNFRLFNGKSTEFQENSLMIIDEHGKIERVGRAKDFEFPEEGSRVKTIDLQGNYVLPGMIDCHIHMDLHGMADTYEENLVEDKLRTIRAAKAMEHTLQAGFTTVRNVGSVNYIDFAVKQGIEHGWVNGPRILTSGRILSITCSGIEYFNGMYEVVDGYDQFKKAAREQLKMGADFLKVMATGAFMNPGGIPGAEQPDVRELEAIVEEANKLGKKVAAHAHGAQGIKNAIKAGVSTIEHGTFADDEAIELMVKHGVYLIPTFAVDYFWLKHGVEGGVPAHMIEKAEEAKGVAKDSARRALKAGVKVAMGTDAGTPYNYHGNNAIELVIYVEEGLMSPAEAIICATRTAAEACNIDAITGTLEEGKYADLMVLDANPLEDIHVLTKREHIKQVYKEGRVVVGF